MPNNEKTTYYSLFQTYHDRVFNFLLKYTEDIDHTKELTYQVFLTSWEKLQTLPGQESFESLVYEVARDTIIDEHRKKFAQQKADLFLTHQVKS